MSFRFSWWNNSPKKVSSAAQIQSEWWSRCPRDFDAFRSEKSTLYIQLGPICLRPPTGYKKVLNQNDWPVDRGPYLIRSFCRVQRFDVITSSVACIDCAVSSSLERFAIPGKRKESQGNESNNQHAWPVSLPKWVCFLMTMSTKLQIVHACPTL